ncbi:phage major capsid protein [Rhodococcus opacus]|uniref:phage major capsid protein n=1 Tax=Rhodococcus opacus TaxID=37919 RepID=UPI001F5A47C2|nr:phage major capsid protein [Rhodococcus opacus]UNN00743.1 phage major capsid protein [Rhodococcus opacus]
MYTTKIKGLGDAARTQAKIAQDIAEKAKREGRAFTAGERTDYDAALAKGKDLLAQLQTAKADAEVLDGAKALAAEVGMPGAASAPAGHAGHLALGGKSAKALSVKIAGRMMTEVDGRKALAPTGTTVTDVPMLPESPIALGKPAQGLLDVLAVQVRAPKYTYLRQSTRTNNAAPVADGATKPTSVLGLTQVDAELRVVAHMSEPIPKYWIEDARALEQFVADELVYGLNVALEGQALTGDSTGANLDGITTTSGTQAQAFATDLLTTTRTAITKLETAGHEAGVFVLSPGDWEKLELARTDTAGNLELGGPVDRAARKLWGVPVVLSLKLPATSAVLLDVSAVGISTDSSGVQVQWSENVSDDFSKNQIRARVEGRFQVDVFQPLGVVEIATAAA